MHLQLKSFTRDGKIGKYDLFELFCLEPDTDTVKKLKKQVQFVLSGKYKKQLLQDIQNKELKFPDRRKSALSVERTYPEEATAPLISLIVELAHTNKVQGHDYNGLCEVLVRRFPNEAARVWLQLCKSDKLPENSYVFHYVLTERIGRSRVTIAQFQKHLPAILKRYEKWKKHHSGETPAAYLLPIFANHNCRSDEVKAIVMNVLRQEKIAHVERILQSTAKLNFPESVPLFWKHHKKLKSANYKYSNNIPHPFVSGVMVNKGGSGKVTDAKDALYKAFASVKGNLSETPPIGMGSGWYFLTRKDAQGNQSIYFVARCHDNTSGPRQNWTYRYVPVMLIGQKPSLSSGH